ncbi:hypothetical protein SAMN05421823_106184 [Catalinimonas alkaloidigena]|uniref:Lipocalin-like domain-containing protein n=1 Tax=Catalinimonas alkaloidigena TaxID=1075417 RepID=A0A1G9KJT3_9BACT|nr:hypothetical protein [Catalinimonas alkaloidigena]SDL49991.1 hypothetical protein SAMN05421823_106184 [Catalinimonas alkaloidigena]
MKRINLLLAICIIACLSCKKEEVEPFKYEGAWNVYLDSTHVWPAPSFTYFYEQGVELKAKGAFLIRRYDYTSERFTTLDGEAGTWAVNEEDQLVFTFLGDNFSPMIYTILSKSKDELILGPEEHEVYLIRDSGQ